MVGRFSAILDPIIWGGIFALMVDVLGYPKLIGQGVGLLFLLGMIFVSRAILRTVDDSQRDWAALRL